MRSVLFTLLMLCIVLSYNGQDKVLLMNGTVDRGKIMEEDEGLLKLKVYKNGGKEKLIDYEKYRVFSVEDILGKERILYQRDSSIGNFYSENQMRLYIYGERDARTNYKNTHHVLLGGAIGSAVSLLDTYEFDQTASNGAGFFKHSPSVVSILTPFVVAIGSTMIKSNIRKEYASDLSYLSSEEYIEGFNKVKWAKKFKGAFLGSIAGAIIGLGAYYAAN